jgi:hypothetical protein
MDPLTLIPAYTTTPDKKQLKIGNVADLGVLPSIFNSTPTSPLIETVNSSDDGDESNGEDELKQSPALQA